MQALILAAGTGTRLDGLNGHDGQPKCLLDFGGTTLLTRHLKMLQRCGIGNVALVVGYRVERIERELAQYPTGLEIELIENPAYREGSIVSLWAARQVLSAGKSTLLMDADVLYDQRLLDRLVRAPGGDCLLMDRDYELGEEPVKVCLQAGRLVEFSKQPVAGLEFDCCGESVGFFRLSAVTAERLAELCLDFIAKGRNDEPHEAALRELMIGHDKADFTVEDITGLPWLEIDFPDDVRRAREQVLPRLTEAIANP